jgi:CRP/FNR family transcriptional regulator
MDVQILLRQNSLFKGLSDNNQKMLGRVCVLRTVRKKELLFHEGEKGDALYILSSGSIQLVKTSACGREVVVKTVEPGEAFAEVILFELDRYPVTAVALKKSVVYRILKLDIIGFLADPSFRKDFIAMLMRKMRYLADRILFLSAFDVEQRFFSFFEDQYGRKSEYALGMARKDIAAAAGISPETLSRLLLRLKEEKKISMHGKLMRVNPSAWKVLVN